MGCQVAMFGIPYWNQADDRNLMVETLQEKNGWSANTVFSGYVFSFIMTYI